MVKVLTLFCELINLICFCFFRNVILLFFFLLITLYEIWPWYFLVIHFMWNQISWTFRKIQVWGSLSNFPRSLFWCSLAVFRNIVTCFLTLPVSVPLLHIFLDLLFPCLNSLCCLTCFDSIPRSLSEQGLFWRRILAGQLQEWI